jgi:hypothetical protein
MLARLFLTLAALAGWPVLGLAVAELLARKLGP